MHKCLTEQVAKKKFLKEIRTKKWKDYHEARYLETNLPTISMSIVGHFDQRLGAVNSKYWSKYPFSVFKHILQNFTRNNWESE